MFPTELRQAMRYHSRDSRRIRERRVRRGCLERVSVVSVSRFTIAAVRFGYGLNPAHPGAGASDAPGLLGALAGRDAAAERWPIAGLAERGADIARFVLLRRRARAARRAGRRPDAETERNYRTHRREMRGRMLDDLKSEILRAVWSETGFRERLVHFWADHFTVEARGAPMRFVLPAFAEDAIRPNLTARFGDMLRAAVLHPAMLVYLDQVSSFGPHSPAGRRRGKGLNENLARELLELHTLGVGAPYTQDDVRQMAELLTGLTYHPSRGGFVFQPQRAEPGAEVVLGRSYGGGRPRLDDILRALDDLAVMPATAGHIARKLAVHFVSDDPDPGLVAAMRQAFLDTGGDLSAVYAAMLTHPAAWSAAFPKARQPFDFIIAGLRALQVAPGRIQKLNPAQFNALILGPLQAMGQPPYRPGGPNGWDEELAAWITPQGLAARIDWAMTVPRFLARVPDPRSFAEQALGDRLRPDTRFVVARAESRWEGVGLALASPEFNRR